MKSIRRRMLLWFLLGLGVLWLVAGLGVFFSIRARLLANTETELLSLLRQVRVNQMDGFRRGQGGSGYGGGGMTGARDFGPGIYWQVWPQDGAPSTRSENLSADLPRFDADHGQSLIQSMMLEKGTRTMVAGAQFGMGRGGASGDGYAGGRGVEVSVAKDLADVHRTLLNVFLGIVITGIAVGGMAVLWVIFIVRDGLRPLRRITDEVVAIDTGSLSGRFKNDDLPDELQPIVSQLNQLMMRLEKSFTRERRFSSDLAHEMRTPVTELRLLAESAVKWPDEGGREAWDAVLGSVDRMELVVQAMLQLAGLEQGVQNLPRESLALRPLVEEVWATHETRAIAHRLTLRLNIKPDATVLGDPALWHHLLGNLLGNATDYADEGSEVVVSTEPGTTEKGLVVCVANAAARLEAEDVDHLFDRFWRGDTARSGSSHCGLGLPLARACGEAMGWRVQASFRPDDGWLEIRLEPGDKSVE